MFNPDGTEGEMCGNALRSVGKYVYDHALTDKTELVIETLGGMQRLVLTVEDREARDGERAMPQGRGFVSNIRADIGFPCLDTAKIPVNTALPEFVEQCVRVLDRDFYITAVSWGNPHVAMFVEDVDTLDVEKYGRAIEYMTELFPNKTNVTFAEVISRDELKMREWERGTGETIGCGTGCCTAAVAGVLTGRCNRRVTVHQIGGPLLVEWDETSGRMLMTGPSHNVFEGEIDISHLF
jgi:diaminopimelate epimerase